ncbi:hypothetical protein HMPREF3190_00758, partial [Umbribacter vaginalis]
FLPFICYFYVQTQRRKQAGLPTVTAFDRAIRCSNANTESVYDARGILFM